MVTAASAIDGRRLRYGYAFLATTVAADVVAYLSVWGGGHLGRSVQDVAVVLAMALVVVAWGCTVAAMCAFYRESTPWTVMAVLLCLAQLFVVLIVAVLTRVYFDPNWLTFEY